MPKEGEQVNKGISLFHHGISSLYFDKKEMCKKICKTKDLLVE